MKLDVNRERVRLTKEPRTGSGVRVFEKKAELPDNMLNEAIEGTITEMKKSLLELIVSRIEDEL